MELNKNTDSVKKQYSNGDVYNGAIINNLREGKGTLIRNKLSSFLTEIKQAIEAKKIIFYCADKEASKRKFPTNKLNGVELFFYEGDKYEGEFNNDKINGKGIMSWHNGNIYEGEFKNNFFEGEGKLTFVSKSYYQGHFVEGMQMGKGIFSYSNGDKYDGEWKDGLKEGKEHINIITETNISENGNQISKMVKVFVPILTKINMMETG